EFLRKEFSEENIKFWSHVQRFKKLNDKKKIPKEAITIYKKYLATDAEEPVNVDSSARKQAERCMKNPTIDMFDLSQKQIYNLMKSDSYRRFLDSDIYGDYLDLEKQRKHPFVDKEGGVNETFFRRDLRRSIIPWQRAKSAKSRLSLPGSSTKKIIHNFSRSKTLKRSEHIATASANNHHFTPRLKKKEPLSTPKRSCDILSALKRNEADSEKKKHTSPISSSVEVASNTFDKVVKESGSDVSFSDDAKSEAFFADLMLISQKVPLENKQQQQPPMSPFIPPPALFQKRSRKSVMIESQISFFPTAYVSKEKIYV
ncbi:uncharacterized protein B4U79_09193, partial [Dinothrombium tinctorium]